VVAQINTAQHRRSPGFARRLRHLVRRWELVLSLSTAAEPGVSWGWESSIPATPYWLS